MIDSLKRKAAQIGIAAIVMGVWLSGEWGWLGTVAAAPFAIGIVMHLLRDE